MDQFSPAELAELYFIRESAIELQFQFWITVTFAVVVASFVAGERLNRKLRSVVALLYLLAAIVLISRWYYTAMDALLFSSALRELGVAVSFPLITIVFRVLLVFLGTSATLIFLLGERFHYEPHD